MVSRAANQVMVVTPAFGALATLAALLAAEALTEPVTADVAAAPGADVAALALPLDVAPLLLPQAARRATDPDTTTLCNSRRRLSSEEGTTVFAGTVTQAFLW